MKYFRNNILKPRTVLIVAASLYVLIFSALVLWKFSRFYYDNLDLAIFNQIFFNTLHGDLFAATIHPPSYLTDHFSPLILLLAPLYALMPAPPMLLILQTIAIAATAFVLYAIARLLLPKQRTWLALVPAVLWLLNPTVQNMNAFEFSMIPFAIVFLLCAIWAYLSRKPIFFTVFLLLALNAREDVLFVVFFLSIFAFLDKRSWFWKLFPAGLAVLWASIAFTTIAAVSPLGSYKFLIYYGWLGGSDTFHVFLAFLTHPIAVLAHQFTFSNLEFILGITFPFFFLVFLPSRYYLLLAAPLAQLWLADYGGNSLELMTHHGGLIVSGLALVFIERLNRLQAGKLPRALPRPLRTLPGIIVLVLFASAYASATYGVLVPATVAAFADNQVAAKRAAVAAIPDDAAVAATFELLTPLSSRSHLYAIQYAALGKNQFALSEYALPPDTRYLAIDWQDIHKLILNVHEHARYADEKTDIPQRLHALLADFKLIFASGSVTVWERGEPESRIVALDDPSLEAGPLLQLTRIYPNGGQVVVKGILPNANSNNEYSLRVAQGNRTFTVPIGYALLSQADLTSGKKFGMPLFLDPSEGNISVRLYQWTRGALTIGQLKNLKELSDAKPIGNPMTLQPDTP